ncbi:hypothetical protein BDV95DRAFT_53848 [Massariosphaeria phaeospora]|uniref:MalT-like TPR region domain-containing protein n=1 Tax=Massariosphaeria phaeospora TaxID=100035 RepID=A0A7C8I8V3_9PLEO|nr:hypothetical protein BDV95DRAFT_53848 [Massariosphaeria phaeospora]
MSFAITCPNSHHSASTHLQTGSVWSKKIILPLLYAMGGRVPKIVLDRATCSQQRMNQHGKPCQVTASHAGLHPDIMDLLDAKVLSRNIEHLISLSIIHVIDSSYVSNDELARNAFYQAKEHWLREAFRLCCHVFPRSPIIDPSFGSIGRELLDALRHLLRLHAENGLEPPHCQETVETLLAASRLETANTREKLLVQAANSGSYLHKTHLHAEIAHEWSVFFRSQGRIQDSDRVIRQFLHHHGPNIQVSWVSLGRLRISQAYNLAYKFDFDTAHETLKWLPSSDNLSEGEVYLLCDQLLCSGRILRGQGRFEEAKHCLDSCIATIGLLESKRLLIVSHLSDLHCELDYAQCNNQSQTHLKEAKEMVVREIGGARESHRHSRGLRRLLLSLLEVDIRQGLFHEAKTWIKELLDLYNKLLEPDINDKIGHVRALIARARISHLNEAEGCWMAALDQNSLYNPGEEDVFTCGIIYLFVSLTRLQLGRVEESKHAFRQAREVISRKQPQYLIPGIGTYLFHYVTSELQSRAGWTLPKIAH